MDLLKTPSIQSLLDSDLESVDSLHGLDLDVEELDEIEYALPASEAPTLAEALSSSEEGESPVAFKPEKPIEEPALCSALQVDFLQAISQQILQAQERSAAGAATTLSVSASGSLTVGTGHGHLLSFQDQVLRWVCDSNAERGAVSCLSYNANGDRILAGFARGQICQYESTRGVVLRRVTLGGELWGILRVAWAGTTGLALDTGGSVWLIKFSRPLGVRAAKTSCLFSGARGEVVAMEARDARVLALATLTRVVVVAGGRAAGVRLDGPPHTLPALAWSPADDRLLLCARSLTLAWLSVEITGSGINVRAVRRLEVSCAPVWLGWVGGALALLDVHENLRLWGEDYDKPLDLSHVEPVYASAFFKGVWTDGRVSAALVAAGGAALGGAEARGGALVLLGRRGVVRVRARDRATRARSLFAAGLPAPALRLLDAMPRDQARPIARELLYELADRPYLLDNKTVAEETVKLCSKLELEELWTVVWSGASASSGAARLAEAAGAALARGGAPLPPPDAAQALLERLADAAPALLERVVAALPLTALDPHQAVTFTKHRRLWRAYGALAAALGGCTGAMRELTKHVNENCRRRTGEDGDVDEGGVEGGWCGCAGDALLLAAADGLAGRGAAGLPLPDHARPSARHAALQTLLTAEKEGEMSPLEALVRHDAASVARLLEQGWHAPPFVGPLGKQNRLRVARAVLQHAEHVPEENQLDIVELIATQVSSGSLPAERELSAAGRALALRWAASGGRRGDRALLALARRDAADVLPRAAHRPRLAWRLAADLAQHQQAVTHFFRITEPTDDDVDEFFAYLRTRLKDSDGEVKGEVEARLVEVSELHPARAALLLAEHFPARVAGVLRDARDEAARGVAERLLEVEALSGEAALVYLEQECARRPEGVPALLARAAAALRPEDALRLVRQYNVRDAEPSCLEAAGDAPAALRVLLDEATAAARCGDEARRVALLRTACDVCARAELQQPRAVAADMWVQALSGGAAPGAGALAAAMRLVPAATLVTALRCSADAARRLVRGAAEEAACWAAAARLRAREQAARSARAVRAAGAGAAVRGGCAGCGRALGGGGGTVLVRVCAHGVAARHAGCAPGGGCARCGEPRRSLQLPARTPTPAAADAPRSHDLTLIAPPRPDLEGIV